MSPARVERHRFDVEEYHRMVEAGVLREDDRVELIGGQVVDMTPIGWRHINVVNRLTMLLASFALESDYTVSVQNPVRLGAHDEPDLALLVDEPRNELPRPEDTPLVIEVLDSSLAYDEEVKLPLYAAAGIGEAWVVDLTTGRVGVYTEPTSDGYRALRVFGAGERLRLGTVEGLALAVDEVFA